MRKRNIRFELCFTKDEMTQLKRNAKKCGLSLGGYIRSVISGSVPKEKPDKEFYDMMRELSAIGNRINQLAAKANALNFIDAPMLSEEIVKWAKFQTGIQAAFLLPDKKF